MIPAATPFELPINVVMMPGVSEASGPVPVPLKPKAYGTGPLVSTSTTCSGALRIPTAAGVKVTGREQTVAAAFSAPPIVQPATVPRVYSPNPLAIAIEFNATSLFKVRVTVWVVLCPTAVGGNTALPSVKLVSCAGGFPVPPARG